LQQRRILLQRLDFAQLVPSRNVWAARGTGVTQRLLAGAGRLLEWKRTVAAFRMPRRGVHLSGQTRRHPPQRLETHPTFDGIYR
jgi:hypothetical protein